MHQKHKLVASEMQLSHLNQYRHALWRSSACKFSEHSIEYYFVHFIWGVSSEYTLVCWHSAAALVAPQQQAAYSAVLNTITLVLALQHSFVGFITLMHAATAHPCVLRSYCA